MFQGDVQAIRQHVVRCNADVFSNEYSVQSYNFDIPTPPVFLSCEEAACPRCVSGTRIYKVEYPD